MVWFMSCLYNNNNWLALNRVNYLGFLQMSPLILLLFTTEYHNIMMNSMCSVVYLSPLHTSFMQVFFGLLTLLPIFLNWTPKSEEKFFHQKRESFNSLSGLKKVWKLVFLFLSEDRIFLFGKKQHIFGKYTLEKWNFEEEKTFPKIHFQKVHF